MSSSLQNLRKLFKNLGALSAHFDSKDEIHLGEELVNHLNLHGIPDLGNRSKVNDLLPKSNHHGVRACHEALQARKWNAKLALRDLNAQASRDEETTDVTIEASHLEVALPKKGFCLFTVSQLRERLDRGSISTERKPIPADEAVDLATAFRNNSPRVTSIVVNEANGEYMVIAGRDTMKGLHIFLQELLYKDHPQGWAFGHAPPPGWSDGDLPGLMEQQVVFEVYQNASEPQMKAIAKTSALNTVIDPDKKLHYTLTPWYTFASLLHKYLAVPAELCHTKHKEDHGQCGDEKDNKLILQCCMAVARSTNCRSLTDDALAELSDHPPAYAPAKLDVFTQDQPLTTELMTDIIEAAVRLTVLETVYPKAFGSEATAGYSDDPTKFTNMGSFSPIELVLSFTLAYLSLYDTNCKLIQNIIALRRYLRDTTGKDRLANNSGNFKRGWKYVADTRKGDVVVETALATAAQAAQAKAQAEAQAPQALQADTGGTVARGGGSRKRKRSHRA